VNGDIDALVDPQDREYVESLADDGERAVVLTTLLRYRVPEQLGIGDRVPSVSMTRLGPPGVVYLDRLGEDRPVVLVFGSYT
jgi:hypothetical protein